MKPLTLIFSVIVITSSNAIGQSTTPQVINSTGNTYKHGYYILEWSIGETALVNQMESSNSLSIITNGLLQPFTQYMDKADRGNPFTADEITILPNPTRDISEINFKTRNKGKVKLQLFDATGYIIYTKEFYNNGNGHIEKIDMTAFASGGYILRILLVPAPGSVEKTGVYKILKIS